MDDDDLVGDLLGDVGDVYEGGSVGDYLGAAPARRAVPQRRPAPIVRRAVVRAAGPTRANAGRAGAPTNFGQLASAFDNRRADRGPGLRGFFMPFTGGSFSLTVGTLSLTAAPQRRFLGQRLVISLGRNGTSATGVVSVTNLTVGVAPQLINLGNMPADAFAANSFGTDLAIDAAGPGDVITLALSVTPQPTTTDTISVAAGFIGEAIG